MVPPNSLDSESLFDELKRYTRWNDVDEESLRRVHPHAFPELPRIAAKFYQRILEHEGARRSLEGGETVVGRLKGTLVVWMDEMMRGPWDGAYYEKRARIGRVHVRIALPQHYMFGAMNLLRQELQAIVYESWKEDPDQLHKSRVALGKMLDMELAIMLHTYREDLLTQQAKVERLSTFGQLVGSIGHELRNPLGVIESSLFILKGRLVGDERVTKHLNRIGEQVQVANKIIGHLLDLIRDRPLARTPVRLREVIEGALESLPFPPGVSLLEDHLEDLPYVSGDATQLRQVFTNLLQNALQAVGEKGEVRILAHRFEEYVELSVEDTGPGVVPDVRRRLFEPLVTSKSTGIGLGLALVKRIVERHGGSIRYEAGQGARFVVRLPLDRSPGGAELRGRS